MAAPASQPTGPVEVTAESAAAPAAPAAAAAAPKAPKAPKEKKAKKGGDLAAGLAALELEPKPEYFAHRIELFERLKKEQDDQIAGQSSCARASSTRVAGFLVLLASPGCSRCTEVA